MSDSRDIVWHQCFVVKLLFGQKVVAVCRLYLSCQLVQIDNFNIYIIAHYILSLNLVILFLIEN